MNRLKQFALKRAESSKALVKTEGLPSPPTSNLGSKSETAREPASPKSAKSESASDILSPLISSRPLDLIGAIGDKDIPFELKCISSFVPPALEEMSKQQLFEQSCSVTPLGHKRANTYEMTIADYEYSKAVNHEISKFMLRNNDNIPSVSAKPNTKQRFVGLKSYIYETLATMHSKRTSFTAMLESFQSILALLQEREVNMLPEKTVKELLSIDAKHVKFFAMSFLRVVNRGYQLGNLTILVKSENDNKTFEKLYILR